MGTSESHLCAPAAAGAGPLSSGMFAWEVSSVSPFGSAAPGAYPIYTYRHALVCRHRSSSGSCRAPAPHHWTMTSALTSCSASCGCPSRLCGASMIPGSGRRCEERMRFCSRPGSCTPSQRRLSEVKCVRSLHPEMRLSNGAAREGAHEALSAMCFVSAWPNCRPRHRRVDVSPRHLLQPPPGCVGRGQDAGHLPQAKTSVRAGIDQSGSLPPG
jgi:hypothetical protein